MLAIVLIRTEATAACSSTPRELAQLSRLLRMWVQQVTLRTCRAQAAGQGVRVSALTVSEICPSRLNQPAQQHPRV